MVKDYTIKRLFIKTLTDFSLLFFILKHWGIVWRTGSECLSAGVGQSELSSLSGFVSSVT